MATAGKMLRAIYAMLRDRVPCVDPKTDCERLLAEFNTPRSIRNLKRVGFAEQGPRGDWVIAH